KAQCNPPRFQKRRLNSWQSLNSSCKKLNVRIQIIKEISFE
ncbi:hypothetical protein GCK32_021219, partial [Trichostrongylus colubriformis]